MKQINSSKTLFVFRHGETDWNLNHRLQGGTDIELNETGRTQARKLGDFFKSNPVEVFLSSDLCRARETAEIATSHIRAPIIIDSRLRETNLGVAEGLTRDEVEIKFGADCFERWRSIGAYDKDFRFPSGESKAEHLARILAALHEFVSKTHHVRIGVATHGGSIRRLIHHLRPELAEPAKIGNCVVYQMSYEVERGLWLAKDDPIC
jgi:broad specificity phosphatase PhoE